MALSAESTSSTRWCHGDLTRRDPDPDPVQSLAKALLRRLNSAGQGQWSAPAAAMEATELIRWPDRHKGRVLASRFSPSRGERLERPDQTAPGLRRSER